METSGRAFFGQHAATIVDNGFSVVAVLPATKRPRYQKWQMACFRDTDLAFLARHVSKHPADSIGLACGTKITGIDIDESDPVVAAQIHQIAREELGDTPLVRYGQYPKRVLVYRAREQMDTVRAGKVDVLAAGAKFVAFGIHPVTGQPYHWPEDNPADTDLTSLPGVDKLSIERFLQRLQATMPSRQSKKGLAPSQPRTPMLPSPNLEARIVRNSNGKVIDGREAYLTLLTWQEYQGNLSAVDVAHRAWRRFVAGADLSRPKGSSRRDAYSIKDAIAKAKSIVRKAPPRITRRYRPGVDARHLHSLRRPGFWTVERKQAHQAQAALRGMSGSRLAANAAMLEAVPTEAGQCEATVRELMEVTGLSMSAVKTSRAKLVEEGLWIVERGVYAPSAAGAPAEDTEADTVLASMVSAYMTIHYPGYIRKNTPCP
jgi:hypothetical protein